MEGAVKPRPAGPRRKKSCSRILRALLGNGSGELRKIVPSGISGLLRMKKADAAQTEGAWAFRPGLLEGERKQQASAGDTNA